MGKQKKQFPELATFTERIRQAIDEAGGIAAVQRITGISRNTLGNWYNQHTYPDADTLLRFCSKMNLSADFVLGLIDEHNATDDEEVRSITEYTGLSNDAIEALHLAKADPSSIDAKIVILLNDIFALETEFDAPGKYEVVFADHVTDDEYQKSQHRLLGLIAEYINSGSIAEKQVLIEIAGLPVLQSDAFDAIYREYIMKELGILRQRKHNESIATSMRKIMEDRNHGKH